MRVYRGNIEYFKKSTYFPCYCIDGKFYAQDGTTTTYLQPSLGSIVQTGITLFDDISNPITIEAGKYYRLESIDQNTNVINWVEISQQTAESNAVQAVFDIMECTYNGNHMSDRFITATIEWSTPIDFKIGDYVDIQIQSLNRGGNGQAGAVETERFYIYTEPSSKKVARKFSVGNAFETTVKFYPRQYELATVMMRDYVQAQANAENIIYTGFDNVTFYGGAYELLSRAKACLAQRYVDNDGDPLWDFDLADAVNEQKNNTLERYTYSFKGQSVMDAIDKLNDAEGVNTTFYINDRLIRVGYKRPYLCAVLDSGAIGTHPLKLMYGKTSHLPIDIDYGGLFHITKSVNDEMPITKLFAYGSNRNLNRYYCSDIIKSGRYVSKLMLPSFSQDGETDYIISEESVKKYGVREGSKEFTEIYPSLRYISYEDIRGIKYCIKIKNNGKSGQDSVLTHDNSLVDYPIVRVQCYKVVQCTGVNGDGTKGVNKLVECAPPEDLIIVVHSEANKRVKVRLYGGLTNQEAIQKQLAADGKVPTTDGQVAAQDLSNVIPGACFCVHDYNFPDMDGTTHTAEEREDWFVINDNTPEDDPNTVYRIEYVDTFWLTDLYVFKSYNQLYFPREGYAAWAYPVLNNDSPYVDTLSVNELVAVEPIVIPDLSYNEYQRQTTFDIYLRDIGFKIDEQNDFGEMVFVFDNIKVSFLDGLLAGREYNINGSITDHQLSCVCAYDEHGNYQRELFAENAGSVSGNANVAQEAYLKGAIWRLRLNRSEDNELQDIGLILPNKDINAKAGDHIVLLDIYMPDIYVRSAENKLAIEAYKYLNQNDRGNVNYSVEFDKVRIQEIQNYALQMREGVMLRMVDDDLNIVSENRSRILVDGNENYQVSLYTTEETIVDEDETHVYVYDAKDKKKFIETPYDSETHKIEIRLPRQNQNSEFKSLDIKRESTLQWSDIDIVGEPIVSLATSDAWILEIELASDTDAAYLTNAAYNVRFEVIETSPVAYWNVVKEEGDHIHAICEHPIDFTSEKYYELTMAVNPDFLEHPLSQSYHPELHLHSNVGIFTPETEVIIDIVTEGPERPHLTYKFYLDSAFNDKIQYRPGIEYIADGVTDYTSISLIKVVEKDLDENGNVVNYVDFTAESVTIKITDNSRPDNERIMDERPIPLREIQATIKEKTHASTWATLMNRVADTEKEVEKTIKTYESLANEARNHYRELLSLRDNIFDPDGTCTDVFIQTMMLQVGADSMNFQMDKTFTTPTGVMSNFNVGRAAGASNDRFTVYEHDVLHHFVYTQGAQGGTWDIPGGFSTELVQVDGEYPVYFVCIKCRRDSQNNLNEVAWICSTKQYAVNEPEPSGHENDFWYFNWGILTPIDSAGHYAFTETRGNAYMYGDSLICGKISTLAGNSYFDLTHGNFVLSEGTEESAALSYIDGVLTISGINSGENNMLQRLGLLEQQTIGGDNICAIKGGNHSETVDFTSTGTNTKEIYLSEYYVNDAGNKIFTAEGAGDFVFSAKKLICNVTRNGGIPVEGAISEFQLQAIARENNQNVVHAAISLTSGENIRDKRIVTTTDCYFQIFIRYIYENGQTLHIDFEELQLQRGTKSTSYSEYMKHVTDALHGTTQIAGGLVLTNLIMLRDENGVVNTGMSGLNDGIGFWAGGTYQQAVEQVQGLTTQLMKLLPVLLTSDGIGSNIGCFKVDSANQISINSYANSKIVMNAGDMINGPYMDYIDSQGDVKIKITTDSIPEGNMHIIEEDVIAFSSPRQPIFKETGGEVTPGGLTPMLIVGSLLFKNYDLYFGGNYNMSFTDATTLKIAYTTGIRMSQGNMPLEFDVYFGNYKIAHYLGTVSGSMSGLIGYLYLPLSSTFTQLTQIASGSYNLEIRNVFYNNSDDIYFKSIVIGDGDSNSWTDGTITIAAANSASITVIGKNGIFIGNRGDSATGGVPGYIRMTTEGTRTYVRIVGLPNASTGLDQGQAYEKLENFEQFKTSLLDFFDNHVNMNGTMSDWINAFYAMVAKLPGQRKLVCLTE